MGVLDKLMFWKSDDDADPSRYEVSGCFTLPEEDAACADDPGEPDSIGIDGAITDRTPTDS